MMGFVDRDRVWWNHNRGVYFSWGHAWIVVKQAVRLLFFLIWGTRSWLTALAKLLAYVMVLMPGWLRMCWYYFTSNLIVRNVEYGKGHMHRNLLDIYLPSTCGFSSSKRTPTSTPSSSQAAVPVVVFFSGGAWIIGYKLWSALIARGFSACGYITIVPDYRNFPQGDMLAMTEDAQSVLLWVSSCVGDYGGDASNVTLCGQSAGAHIVMTSLLRLLDVLRTNQQNNQQQHQQKQSNGRAEEEDDSFVFGRADSYRYEDRVHHDGDDGGDTGDTEVALTTEEDTTPAADPEPVTPASNSDSDLDNAASWTNQNDSLDGSVDYFTPTALSAVEKPQEEDGGEIGEIKLYNDSVDGEGDMDMDIGFDMGNITPMTDNSCSIHSDNASFGATANSTSIAGGAGTGAEAGDDINEACIDIQLAEFILACVQNVILVNAPSDLVLLEAHCHQKGLDSRILQWICRDDLAAFSPTLLIQKFNDEDAVHMLPSKSANMKNKLQEEERKETKASAGCEAGSNWRDSGCGVSSRPLNSPAREGTQKNSSTLKSTYTGMWDRLPPVSIFSCMDDTSIPISQGGLLHNAMRQAKVAKVIDTSKSHHRVYAKKSHTSLIVEDPLVGDFTLVFDIHRIINRTSQRRKSRCSPASPGSPGYGPGPRLSDSHVDLVLVGFGTSSINNQFHNNNRRRILEKLDIDEVLAEEQGMVIRHHRYGEEEEDAVIRRAKENLGGTVHPYLVSIARKMNPF